MSYDFQIGMFGYFEFIIFKNAKYGGKKATPITGYYKVIEIDDKNVWLSDDDEDIIVNKDLITVFNKDENKKG